MRKPLVILIVVVSLLILIGVPVGLYFLGDDESSILEKLRDVAIVMMVTIGILSTALLAILVAALVALTMVIKDKLVPVLESLRDTANQVKDTTGSVSTQVKGTTEFVTEGIARPLISAYGLVAQARAYTKVVTGKDHQKGDKQVKKMAQQ
jgi:hypothetical protein